MTLAATNVQGFVTISSTGQSQFISLPSHPNGGRFTLQASSAGAFVLDVQVGDGVDFKDLYQSATEKVTLDSTTVTAVSVPGGKCYRMDVDTYNDPITLRVTQD